MLEKISTLNKSLDEESLELEMQIKNWLSYLEHGIHSGNQDFDSKKLKDLLDKYTKYNNHDVNLVKDTNEILKKNEEWKKTQIEITPENDYT